jgi:hypothetical protein
MRSAIYFFPVYRERETMFCHNDGTCERFRWQCMTGAGTCSCGASALAQNEAPSGLEIIDRSS